MMDHRRVVDVVDFVAQHAVERATGGMVTGERLDVDTREAIERANGGPIPWGHAEHAAFKADYLDQQAIMRVIGMISIADHKDAADAARFISTRQSATETPAEFVKRIALALLNQMAGLE